MIMTSVPCPLCSAVLTVEMHLGLPVRNAAGDSADVQGTLSLTAESKDHLYGHAPPPDGGEEVPVAA